MPYKDLRKKREYQRLRLAEARSKWLTENGPCVHCGGDFELEVDHIDRSQKVDHKVWSWSKQRRDAELAKCQVLCSDCHNKKTSEERKVPIPHGTDGGYTRHKCRCPRCKQAHTEKRKSDHAKYGC